MANDQKTPDLSTLVKVIHSPSGGAYTSKLISLTTHPPGALITPITGHTRTPHRAYTSVQIAEDADIELNSQLVYCNHSCDPSVHFDTTNFEVRAARPLRAGDEMTFFYPSTEWEMRQPFDCNCGSARCLGVVRGAKFVDARVLGGYVLNAHIGRLVAAREEGKENGNGLPN